MICEILNLTSSVLPEPDLRPLSLRALSPPEPTHTDTSDNRVHGTAGARGAGAVRVGGGGVGLWWCS